MQYVFFFVQVTQCYVDLDSGVVECPEDQPILPFHDELTNKIHHALKKYKNSVGRITHFMLYA